MATRHKGGWPPERHPRVEGDDHSGPTPAQVRTEVQHAIEALDELENRLGDAVSGAVLVARTPLEYALLYADALERDVEDALRGRDPWWYHDLYHEAYQRFRGQSGAEKGRFQAARAVIEETGISEERFVNLMRKVRSDLRERGGDNALLSHPELAVVPSVMALHRRADP